MKRWMMVVLISGMMLAQAAQNSEQAQTQLARYTVPAGTTVLMALKSPISTKNAQPGSPVYAQTTFPVALDNHNLIPAGSYVQGVVDRVQRAPHAHGRAQLQVHFTTLIFPNGYTVSLPGSLAGAPANENDTVKGKEGSVEGGGRTGQDLKKVGQGAAIGASVGSIGGAAGGRTLEGAGIGAGAGAAAGLLVKMFSRGPDIRFEAGTPIEMVLDRPLVLEDQHMPNSQLQPVQTNHPLEKSNQSHVPTIVPGAERMPFPQQP